MLTSTAVWTFKVESGWDVTDLVHYLAFANGDNVLPSNDIDLLLYTFSISIAWSPSRIPEANARIRSYKFLKSFQQQLWLFWFAVVCLKCSCGLKKGRESRCAGWDLQTGLLSSSQPPVSQIPALRPLQWLGLDIHLIDFNVHLVTDDFSGKQNRYSRSTMTVTELVLLNRLDHLFLIPFIFLLHSGFCNCALLFTSSPLKLWIISAAKKNKMIKTLLCKHDANFVFWTHSIPQGLDLLPTLQRLSEEVAL